MIKVINHLPALMVVVPLMSSLIIPLVGIMKNRAHYYFMMFVLFVMTILSSTLLIRVLSLGVIRYNFGGWQPPWGIVYTIDPLNAFVAFVVVIVGFTVGIYSKKSVEFEFKDNSVQFCTIYLLFFTGLIGMTVTGDLFNVYVFLEITSLTAYTLIASGKTRDSLIASFDYIILGTIAASFILLGIGYLYMATGTLNMADLAKILPTVYSSKVVITALIFIVVGLAIKVAMFPMHTWLPNAYTHAPIAAIPFIAGVMSKVGVYVLIRVLFTIFGYNFSINALPITIFLSYGGALAVIAGSILALMQNDIRRMLAYSSISQIGLIMVGIGIGNELALIGSILHILGHAVMKSCLFMVVGSVNYKYGVTEIVNYKNMFKKLPIAMIAFGLATFSMVGFPPSIGFVSKFYLTQGAIKSGNWLLAVVIVGSGLLTLGYFWRVIELIFFSKEEVPTSQKIESNKADKLPPSMVYPMIIFGAAAILLGIFSLIPLSAVSPAVTSILKGVR